MKNNATVNIGKKGMNRDTHPSLLDEYSYTFALNATYEDTTSNDGFPLLQNERSNSLSISFGDDVKVVGIKNDLTNSRTILFLHNTRTGVSEIGSISSTKLSEGDSDIEEGVNGALTLGEPLETITQEGNYTYERWITDECLGGCDEEYKGCLNFSIDHPIKEGNIHIKSEKCGEVMYWTDFYNPPRHLVIDKLDEYRYKQDTVGGNGVTEICQGSTNERQHVPCVDCDALRVFPLYTIPNITPTEIQYGGNLKAGTYEFLIAYCNQAGEETTQYYSITNPITIFDEGNNILGKDETWQRTNLGIKLNISLLDKKFRYYKVAVIQTEAQSGVTDYYIEGIHPTGDDTILFYSEAAKLKTNLNDLITPKQVYNLTEIMASNNGYLFHGGLVSEKEINLQPVVNLMGPFLKWRTVKKPEDLYKDTINTSLYKTYMRDESYPFSIRFQMKNGFETSNYILPNRPPTVADQAVVGEGDIERRSIESVSKYGTEGRTMKWQYHNTAQETSRGVDDEYYAEGDFGYVESVVKYSDNEELYNSKGLVVKKEHIDRLPPLMRDAFYFTYYEDEVNDEIILNENANLAGKNIRHYKFPDFNVSPFMSEGDDAGYGESYIYPIGAYLDPTVVEVFLDIAEDSGLITADQRGRITQYEIFRGDRTLDKSVIAKGLAFDMKKYKENDVIDNKGVDYDNLSLEDTYFSNYPYNDLSTDELLKETGKEWGGIQDGIKHPYGGTKNDKFTFHSPDTHFRNPGIPKEAKVEAYMQGYSRGRFVSVEDHSKWVILSSKAFTLAETLAAGEVLLELAARVGDFLVQDSIAGNFEKVDNKTEGTVKEDGTQGFNAGITGAGTVAITSSPTQGTIKSTNTYDLEDSGKLVNLNRLTALERAAIIAGMSIDVASRIARYKGEWLDRFKTMGQPENFAYYYTSEGWYNSAIKNEEVGSSIRGIEAGKYLGSGRYLVPNVTTDNDSKYIKINNSSRESSVFISFGKDFTINYPHQYVGKDNSRTIYSKESSFKGLELDGKDSELTTTYRQQSPEFQKVIASPYMSLKSYRPDQYGKIESIKWISTGYRYNLEYNEESNTSIIFGGDIFITRFSLKRKMPLFLENQVGVTDRLPFNYYPYRNVGHPRFFVDYEISHEDTMKTLAGGIIGFIGGFMTGSFKDHSSIFRTSTYNLDQKTTVRNYIKPPSKFYLSYYGIPQFLVESEINCNTRYGMPDKKDNFYPNVGDYVDWTQEKNVPIKTDNSFYYNPTFSKTTTRVATRTLPSTFDKELYDCLYDAPNGVAYSMQDSSEQDLTDPWLIYKPLDFYQFQTSYGKLIDLRGIESTQMLGRFENQVVLFNAVDVLRDRMTPEMTSVGVGGIFGTRPVEYTKADLGYGGTQHKTMVSNEYGHYWVDAKRGHVFHLKANGKGLEEITEGLRDWFKEHLPFKILEGGIKKYAKDVKDVVLKDTDVDNNLKGLGISLGWDSRLKRLFLTKKDYSVRKEYKGKLTFKDGKFYNLEDEVSLMNREVFEDASFTMAYSPLTGSWISYYSFKPDYYISHHNYFQTGINYDVNKSKQGIWAHLTHNNSFQVFYGEKYPFTIEVILKNNYANKVLGSINYWMDSKRFHGTADYAENRKIGFNKAWLYNNSQNSGELNLITSERGNLRQKIEYPKVVDKEGELSTHILATEEDKYWRFNTFFNRVKDELNNQPIWFNDNNQIDLSINPKAIDYNQRWKDRLKGDWFALRLSQDEESRYKVIFKWVVSKEKLF